MALIVYRGKDLVKKMQSVGKAVSALHSDIVSLCVSAALHLEAHGSDGINVVNDLVKMTEKVVHKNAVAVWLNKFAPVTWDSKAKAFKFSEAKLEVFTVSAANNDSTYELDLLQAPTYHELTKPDAPFTPVNLIGLLKSAAKRAENADHEAAEKAGKAHNLVGLEALNKLIGLIESGNYKAPAKGMHVGAKDSGAIAPMAALN